MISGQVSSSGPDVKKAGDGAKRLYRIIKAHEVNKKHVALSPN